MLEMIKLKYCLFILIISDIYGDKLNEDTSRDITYEDSSYTDYNEIKTQDSKIVKFKKVLEQNELAINDSNESFERDSAETKVQNFIKNNNMQDNTSLEKGAMKQDVNNTIENDITSPPEYFNRTVKIRPLSVIDKVANNTTVDAVTLVRNDTSAEETTEKRVFKEIKESERRKLFRNCRESGNYERCRSTLIDYPYVASIQKLGAHYTTGVLLDRRWILTVAAEFYNIRESIKFYRARLGSVNCKKHGVLIPLQEVIIHPLYVHGKPGYDLALLRTGASVKFSDYIRPVRVSSAQERVLSAKFLATYWPRLIVKGEVLPHSAPERTKANSLRVSTQQLIGGQYCQKMMLEMNEHLSDGSSCLKPLVTHHSLCMPDPGAPLVVDDRLWGITSGWTSKLCHRSPGPTIFTQISTPLVRSWLESHLKKVKL